MKKGDKDHLYDDAVKKRKEIQAEMIRQAVISQEAMHQNANRGSLN